MGGVSPLKLILVDPLATVCEAWTKEFKPHKQVQIIHGTFQQVEKYDCLVSPANSFGLMDGGVDLAITQYFGLQLMQRVQETILEKFAGEQPVGTAFLVNTGHSAHPFLVHTPTMRVPQQISGTDNVYRAMLAMLVAVKRHNQSNQSPIKTIVCPGMGTGTGMLEPTMAAKQMELAFRNFLSPPMHLDWKFALEREKEIRETLGNQEDGR